LILPLGHTPWKRSGQSRGGAPWSRADGAGVMRHGGEAGCCAHHRRGCGQPGEIQPAEEGDEIGGRYDWRRLHVCVVCALSWRC